MKRLILFSLFALPLAASAQKAKYYSYLSLGPVGSVGSSWITDWAYNSEDPKPSGSLGIELTYSRAEHTGFGADLAISHEGFTADYLVNGIERDLDVHPVYLRLQPKFIVFFSRYGQRVRPKLWIGPSVGLLLDETSDISPDRPETQDEDQELGERVFSRVDAGVAAGGGFNVRIARATWFTIGAAYYHGVVDVVNDDFVKLDSYNRNLRFTAGVNFGLGVSQGRAHHRDAR